MTSPAPTPPTSSPPAPFNLVVAYDLSPSAALALAEALVLGARGGRAVVHVLGVLGRGGKPIGDSRDVLAGAANSTEEMGRAIAGAVERELAQRGTPEVRAFVHVRIGDPAAEILGLAEEVQAEVVVLGSHGRTGLLERLALGSVAEQVMRAARCPVLVMRPVTYAADGAAGETPEPACAACLARRTATGGAAWWCEEHARPAWSPPHRYGYAEQGIYRLRPDEWALW